MIRTRVKSARRRLPVKVDHGTDLPLIFRNTETFPLTAGSPTSGRVSDCMSPAFAAFAKTGDPGAPDLPWQTYNPASKPTMVFDFQSGVKSDPDHDLLVLLPGPAAQGRGL